MNISVKAIISALFVVMITSYIVGLIGFPFLFIVLLPTIVSLIALLCLLAPAFLLAEGLILRLLSLDIRKIYEKRKSHYRAIILVCLTFFFLSGWAINRYFLPGKFHPVSVLGDVGILFFTIFLGWSLLKPIDRRIILISGAAIFILFFSLLTVVGSITSENTRLSSTEAIKSLPYLAWVPADETIEKSGVIKYDQKQSFKGINIYAPQNSSKAYLMDMSGNILHTWSAKIDEDDVWYYVEMDKNGDLLAWVANSGALIRLDWDSNIKWIKKMDFHHDIAIAGNGDIYSLVNKNDKVFASGLPLPIINNYIVVLSPDGEFKKELSLFKVLKKETKASIVYTLIINPKNLWGLVKNKFYLDVFHTNTIGIIDRAINGLCRNGDLLISVRELDLIGIVDITKEELVWSWGPGSLRCQHHPTLLENGNILIFDNGCERGYSRIVELNPFTKEIVWEYKDSHFFTSTGGANQRLPNGNTLITQTSSGRVFEITKSGNIVWEFYSPEIKTAERKRAGIYRMMRITDPEKFPFFQRLK